MTVVTIDGTRGLALTARIPRRHGVEQVARLFKTFTELRRLRFGSGSATIDILLGLRWNGHRQVGVGELREDMVLASDLKTSTGMLLVAQGTRVTERLVDRIRRHLSNTRGVTVDVCEV